MKFIEKKETNFAWKIQLHKCILLSFFWSFSEFGSDFDEGYDELTAPGMALTRLMRSYELAGTWPAWFNTINAMITAFIVIPIISRMASASMDAE